MTRQPLASGWSEGSPWHKAGAKLRSSSHPYLFRPFQWMQRGVQLLRLPRDELLAYWPCLCKRLLQQNCSGKNSCSKVRIATRNFQKDQVLSTRSTWCKQANLLMSEELLPGVTLPVCQGHCVLNVQEFSSITMTSQPHDKRNSGLCNFKIIFEGAYQLFQCFPWKGDSCLTEHSKKREHRDFYGFCHLLISFYELWL